MSFARPPLVTGATGFVGSALCRALAMPVARLRLGAGDWRSQLESAPLEGAVVFHLAGRAHRPRGSGDAEFDADNHQKTRVLAQAAAARGARHFVFVSSAKVLGDESPAPLPLGAPFAPADAYARSKRDAEVSLRELPASGMRITIVRPPLVYGRGAKGNLESMLRLCASGAPLPFAGLHNRRSWIHVDDLAELLVACAHRDGPALATLHAAHPEPMGTAALVEGLRDALGRPRRTFAVPPFLLEAAATVAGRGREMRRLTRSLELDATSATRELGWRARRSVREALADLARGAP